MASHETDTLLDRTYVPPRDTKNGADLQQDFLTSCKQVAELASNHTDNACLTVNGSSVPVNGELLDAFADVAKALGMGLGISLVPHQMKLTTQQAADLLQISRPTLVRLLERGEIPYDKISRHRRLYLRDVIAYRDSQRRISDQALSDIVSDTEMLGLYDVTPAEIAAVLGQSSERDQEHN